MEAELVDGLPTGERWRYEPKWDGFRGVFENDGGELALWSRNGRPLLRYFPELRAIGAGLPPHSALDGEIVIEREGALDFDAMQMRLHRGRIADPQALQGDARDVHRVRHPPVERRGDPRTAACGSARRARAARDRVHAVAADEGPRARGALARATRDDRARRGRL